MSASLPSAVPASGATKHLVDPATKAQVTEMIAGGGLEGYRSQARATLTFEVRHRLGSRARTARSAGHPVVPYGLLLAWAVHDLEEVLIPGGVPMV